MTPLMLPLISSRALRALVDMAALLVSYRYNSLILHIRRPSRYLGSSEDNCLFEVLYQSTSRGGQAFSFNDPSVWNCIPQDTQNVC